LVVARGHHHHAVVGVDYRIDVVVVDVVDNVHRLLDGFGLKYGIM
jgi:hypothetical protein